MKQFFKMFFASLLAITIASFLVIVFIISIAVSATKSITTKEETVESGSVLVLDLSKSIKETGESNSFAVFSKESSYKAGLFDITRALTKAGKDDNIKGLLIKLNPSSDGWATLQQLRGGISSFKQGGKFVYSYGENITQSAYYVATAGDSIYLNPVGGFDLKGFATVLAFFKGTLDKLDLQPEIFYAGKFKSATEPFRAEKISEPNREQIMAMQNGLWSEFLGAAASFTHLPKDTIHSLAVQGAIQFPEDAYKHKLVSALLYWDEVEQRIKKGAAISNSTAVKYVTIDEYTSANRNTGEYSENRIAVLMAQGAINDGEQDDEQEIASQDFCEEVRKLSKDSKVKAVVLRVNSPGGSALASDVILRELMLLKQRKPLVVSMGDYAASGGYYISCKADSIFALPTTITGSIGVFSMMFNVDKLMKNKLGVTFDEVKNAPFADVPTATRAMNAQESAMMQQSVDKIYSIFKGHVVAGRKLSQAEVDSIAQGRIWTGTDALRLHLVDRLGGLNEAIASAASLARLKEYKVVTAPEADDKVEIIMRKFKNNGIATDAVKAAIKEELLGADAWYTDLKNLAKMRGKALTAMPFVPVVQ